jgi:saccharopine dehydrogenase (NAD+, L-lysine-forming)
LTSQLTLTRVFCRFPLSYKWREQRVFLPKIDSMTIKKIGIIREGKVPPDHRVALTPQQCELVKAQFDVDVVVQPSPIRKYADSEYTSVGISLQEDLSDCDLIIGVKEVPIDMLIPGKSYMFFSHTFKKQPYNAKLLKAILDRRIRLIDYEVIKGTNKKRLIGFGRYAGIVGAYHAFRAFGMKHDLYAIKAPHECHDRRELEEQLSLVKLPQQMRVVVTGFGRVGHGAEEILKLLPLRRVTEAEFLSESFNEPVYTHLDTEEYYVRKDKGGFDKADFYNNPQLYQSSLPETVRSSDLYIACHLWASGNPVLISQSDLQHPAWKCRVIADVSCDVGGPIASTLRASTIADPLYGYNPDTGTESDWNLQNAICVMAIDNLPCELPKDASEDFGNELISKVFPHLFNGDKEEIIWHATETTLNGELTPHFAFLKEYAKSASL